MLDSAVSKLEATIGKLSDAAKEIDTILAVNKLDVEDFSVKFKKISPQTQDYIDAYKKLGLKRHSDELTFEAKCEQAKEAGLVQLSEEEIVRMLYPKTNIFKAGSRTETCSSQFYDPFFERTYAIEEWKIRTFDF